jgi:hypothetical protein
MGKMIDKRIAATKNAITQDSQNKESANRIAIKKQLVANNRIKYLITKIER